jgi:hypothetical protein
MTSFFLFRDRNSSTESIYSFDISIRFFITHAQPLLCSTAVFILCKERVSWPRASLTRYENYSGREIYEKQKFKKCVH